MTGTLVVAQISAGNVDPVTAELVSAAVALGEPVTLGVADSDPASIGNTAILGVDRVVGIRMPGDQPGHEVQQRAVEGLLEASGARLALMPFSWDTAAFAAGLAEKHDFGFASDVVDLSRDANGTIVATRLAYGGKVCVRLGLPAEIPAVLLLRAGCWPAAPSVCDGPGMEIANTGVTDRSRVRLVKIIESAPADADLTQAEIIFSVGRGVGTHENIAIFEQVARKFGAALGASRPLVDVGLVPRARQIGQSGVTVKPKLYVAFGISGAIQHLAGISESKTIVAVNIDEQAPIFESAHFGSHVDAMEVARQLLTQD